MLKVAVPDERVPVPRVVAPSRKVIVPAAVDGDTVAVNVTDEPNIDERRARLDKLEVFTKATLAQRNPGSLSLQESLLRPDLNDFKQQFEKNNPDFAKALRQKIAEVPEHDPLVKNDAAIKQTEEAAIKHSAREREFELER